MSLLVTGSGVSYYTSSCAQSGGIFLDDWKVEPHLFYDVTASINYRPENECTASDYSDLGYTVNSYDQTTGVWYHANQYGTPLLTTQYPSASLVGASTAVKTNVASGDCRFNAIQFSGSMLLDIGSGSFAQCYVSIVTGSFTLSGVGKDDSDHPWSMNVNYLNTGSISLFNYGLGAATTKNSLVGFGLGTYQVSAREVLLYVSGSNIATNPPAWTDGPPNLGYTLTLSGVGVLRGFGVTQGSTALQSQYNCIYETTPSK
jgi:hypothetical protein